VAVVLADKLARITRTVLAGERHDEAGLAHHEIALATHGRSIHWGQKRLFR